MILPAILIRLIIGAIVYWLGTHVLGLLGLKANVGRLLDASLIAVIILFVLFGSI